MIDCLELRRRVGAEPFAADADLEALTLETARKLAPYDREQPGFRLALVGERLERLPGPQHRLLDHVLGQRPVPAEPERVAQQVGAQALAQRPETATAVRFSVATVHV